MQEEKQQGSAADGAAHIAQGAQAAYSVISAARAGSTAAGAAVGTATAGPLGTVVGFLVTTKTFWKILGAVFAAILLLSSILLVSFYLTWDLWMQTPLRIRRSHRN